MLHFAALPGILTAFFVPFAIGVLSYSKRKKAEQYYLDPHGTPGAFDPLLQKYLHLAEYGIGLATGSIVLLIGSSLFHGKDGRLPPFYASPLLILAASVATGVLFMAWLLLTYETVQHGNPHTAFAYSLSETLGFSSLVLLLVGYVWLILAVTS